MHFLNLNLKPETHCFQWISGFLFSSTVKDKIISYVFQKWYMFLLITEYWKYEYKTIPHYQMTVGFLKSGSYLLSQDVAIQVPSALRGLTSVFGMGTGVSLLLSPPDENYISIFFRKLSFLSLGQVFGILVPLSLNHCWSYTLGLSTSLSFWCLILSMGNLILRGASCLDAFSSYPFQT